MPEQCIDCVCVFEEYKSLWCYVLTNISSGWLTFMIGKVKQTYICIWLVFHKIHSVTIKTTLTALINSQLMHAVNCSVFRQTKHCCVRRKCNLKRALKLWMLCISCTQMAVPQAFATADEIPLSGRRELHLQDFTAPLFITWPCQVGHH